MKRVNQRNIMRFSDGQFHYTEDKIVTEHAVTIYINRKEFMTIVCTPEFIEDMVIGFLASEKIIGKFTDIKSIRTEADAKFVYVETEKTFPFYERLHSKRYISSCCGMGRQGFVFANDVLTAKKITGKNIQLYPDHCFYLMDELEKNASTFRDTGGVHNAALCDSTGIVLARMDIGRHNALDKIYGYCLKNNISVRDKVIVFSGRISSEILLKVAKIGCEIILSKSAPTELALELAEDLGITTVGFIRGNSFNLYTHPERILG